MIAHLAGHRHQCLEVGEQVANVFKLRMLVRRIGKGWKIMRAGGRRALEHRSNEIRLGPAPDAVGHVGRDVGHIECPERRRNGEPAAEPEAIGLTRHCMTGGTSARIERCEAVGEIRRIGRQQLRRDHRRYGEPPVRRKADGGSNHQAQENFLGENFWENTLWKKARWDTRRNIHRSVIIRCSLRSVSPQGEPS